MTSTPDRRAAQERGIKMGNRVVEGFQPKVNQLISATIHVAGEHDLRIDTHGSHSDRGGHIAVASDNLLIYLHDQKSAKVYLVNSGPLCGRSARESEVNPLTRPGALPFCASASRNYVVRPADGRHPPGTKGNRGSSALDWAI